MDVVLLEGDRKWDESCSVLKGKRMKWCCVNGFWENGVCMEMGYTGSRLATGYCPQSSGSHSSEKPEEDGHDLGISVSETEIPL
jgi:hypothetical protein